MGNDEIDAKIDAMIEASGINPKMVKSDTEIANEALKKLASNFAINPAGSIYPRGSLLGAPVDPFDVWLAARAQEFEKGMEGMR